MMELTYGCANGAETIAYVEMYDWPESVHTFLDCLGKKTRLACRLDLNITSSFRHELHAPLERSGTKINPMATVKLRCIL